MPQDVKLSPDGRVFYVADVAANGVWLVDADRFRRIGFVPTGRGAHGLYASGTRPGSSTSRTVARDRSRSSRSARGGRWGRSGVSPVAAARTWEGVLPRMAGCSGSRGATTAEVYAIRPTGG